MRWQFGGNLQPVRMICEIDWRECPSAILNYVWSEIVTDVVDCLTNEWMMWRVIAMLFVCTLLIHTIYSKTRLINETTTNRDNLNVVGCKVQDLELKVNILTYKMQYGTWPLPRQIRGTGVDAGLRNVRLTLTNSNDRNAWIKHMLLSPSENASCVPYAKIGPRSVRCLTKLINLETKYMSSRFSRDPSPGSNKPKSSHSNSVKSLICAKASSLKIEDEKNIPKSENFDLRRHEKNVDSLNPTNNCWSETQVTRYREFARMKNRQTRDWETGKKVPRNSTKFDKSPEKRVNAPNETLNLVKEKLEDLHTVLRLCSEAKINENEEKKNSNKELAESILQDLKNLGDITTESESEKIVDFLPIILDSNTDDSQCPEEIEKNEQEETMEEEKPNESTSEFEQCQSDDSSWPIVDQGSKIFSESPKMSVEKLEKSVVPRKNSDDIEMERKMSSSRDPKAFPIETGRKSLESDIAISSPISSFTELSKDSDSDDRSNVTLLREALKFKNALITRIELENDENRHKDRQDSRSEDSESDESTWQKLKSNFKSKQLDIISEEQSAASSSEKRTLKKIETISKSTEKSALDEKPYITEISRDPENSRLELESGSSEYFSLQNLVDEKIAKNRQNDLTTENNDRDGEKIAKNMHDLVNDSVQNIRDYIEVFTQMQNNAIVETRRLIDDNDFPRETTSLDSITRFVNTIGITMSEELPRKLSEPAIISLIDLEIIDTDDDSPDTDHRPDFELKRRPGSISIAEERLDDDKSSHNEIVREKSFYLENEILPTGSEVSSINSRDESIVEHSCDISDAKSTSPMINDDESRDREEDRRVDSPMTGRTVIRATGSSTSNFALTNESSEENIVDYDSERNYIGSPIFEIVEIDDTIDIETSIGIGKSMDIDESIDIEKSAEISKTNILPETSSIYFTDEASLTENKLSSPEITESESKTWIFENSPCASDLFGPEVVMREVEKLRDRIEESPEGSESAWIFEHFPNVHKPEVADINVENIDLMEKSKKHGNSARNEAIQDKPEVRLRSAMEKSRRPDSAETVVINSSKIDKKETVSNDNSGTYIDASSREFINLTNKTSEKSRKSTNSRDCKSARGSSSSPLQQRISWSAPKRGSSLNNASEESRKIDSAIGMTEKSGKSLKIVKSKRATRSQSSGNRKIENLTTTGNIDKSKIDEGSIGNDLRDRRSRSYVTPRNFEASTTNLDNSKNFEVSQRPSRTKRDEKLQNSMENVKSLKSLSNEDSTSRCVGKTSSKSCIPILRSRLETVRKNSREKRLKSPARCPLTISTSSWSQENRRIVDESTISGARVEEILNTAEKSIIDREKIDEEEKIGNLCENRSIDGSMENRTVIYVNIVTEQERKSATRVVDPKKFLEYLKDRELKIQSVHDQEIVGKKVTSENEISPKILTIVSSAVENEENAKNVFQPRDGKSGTWSVRVEHREIQVSAKPSVIDTSTSISDFVDDTKNPRQNGDGKFQIFDVPKELTKDEYIILLEALNQDPNLHQLKEMHKLCNKLGLGFHE